jgi:hypothetical protein
VTWVTRTTVTRSIVTQDYRFKDYHIVDALFAAFLISSTAILSVGLGVLGAHYAISAILAAFNPNRPSRFLPALTPNQSQASGD